MVYSPTMPLGDIVEAGTTPKPLRIGRISRLVFGMWTTSYFVWNIVFINARVGTDSVQIGYLIGVPFAWWYLSDAIVVGLGLKWGRWPQIVSIPIAVVLAGIGLAAYESVWAPPLAWGVYLMTQFWFGFIGPSFIFAALFAVPG